MPCAFQGSGNGARSSELEGQSSQEVQLDSEVELEAIPRSNFFDSKMLETQKPMNK